MCRVHEIDTRFMNQSNHWIKVTDAHHYFNQVVSHPHTQKKELAIPQPRQINRQKVKMRNVLVPIWYIRTHKKKLWHSYWHRSTRTHLFSFRPVGFRHKIENNCLPEREKNHYKNKRSNIFESFFFRLFSLKHFDGFILIIWFCMRPEKLRNKNQRIQHNIIRMHFQRPPQIDMNFGKGFMDYILSKIGPI